MGVTEKLNIEKTEKCQKVYPAYQEVSGVRICGGFIADHFLQALEYEARPDDIFIATYPKCGTTWTQQIVFLLLNAGQPPSDAGEYYKRNPFLDMMGKDSVVNMPRPAAIKTHLTFDLVPYHPEAKYICVVRNPKDALVSFFHHTRGIPGYKFSEGDFDTFYEVFMAGHVDYGDYFDHLISWGTHRNDPNVIFLTFEDMKSDVRSAIKTIAQFISPEIAKKLDEDEIFMENVVKYSSFEFMKEQDKKVRKPYEMPEKMLNDPVIPETLKAVVKNMAGPVPKQYAHIRKGQVNDWKNYLTADQNQRLIERFYQKTAGTGLENLWSNKNWL